MWKQPLLYAELYKQLKKTPLPLSNTLECAATFSDVSSDLCSLWRGRVGRLHARGFALHFIHNPELNNIKKHLITISWPLLKSHSK